MSSTAFVMRLMRLMTHLNIGAAFGTAAWIVGSGGFIVNGQLGQPPAYGPQARPPAASTTHRPPPPSSPSGAWLQAARAAGQDRLPGVSAPTAAAATSAQEGRL